MDPFLGEIRMFGGNFAPVGWMFCDGSLLPIAENDALYTLLGTAYGGDGVATFGIPDLRGRAPIHAGNGNGLTPRVMGQMFGLEAVTLTAATTPTHYHPVHASSTPGTQADPTGAYWAAASTGESQYSQANPNIAMSGAATQPSGGGQPHENMMPFQAVSFIIAVAGIYPTQN